MPIDFEITTVTSSEPDVDGFPQAQAHPLGPDASSLPSEGHHAFGFLARPLDPDVNDDGAPTTGCLVLHGVEGNQGHAWPLGDARITKQLPPRPRGSSVWYGASSETDATAKPSIAMFDSSKGGALVVLVPHSGGASSSGIFIDPSTIDAEAVQVRHGAGMGLALVAGGTNDVTINNRAGDGFVTVNDDGVTVSGTKIALNGAVLIGDPVAAAPLVMGPALIAWITGVLLPALASATGGPVVVAPPPDSILSTKAFAS